MQKEDTLVGPIHCCLLPPFCTHAVIPKMKTKTVDCRIKTIRYNGSNNIIKVRIVMPEKCYIRIISYICNANFQRFRITTLKLTFPPSSQPQLRQLRERYVTTRNQGIEHRSNTWNR
jgi:hypothetical protein